MTNQPTIRDGRVDIGYVRLPIDQRGLQVRPLLREARVVVLPGHHQRAVEEKLEHVAAGHGIVVLPLSVATSYIRPDVTYVTIR